MSLIVEDSRNLYTGISFRGRKIKQTKTSVAVLGWNGPNNIRDSRIEVKCVYGILQLKRINLISELYTSAVAVINDQARADIVDYIVEEIDATVEEEKVLTRSCETKVNQTIKSCDECAGNICAAVELRQERKKIDLRKLLSVVHKPVILVASLGKKVAKEAARFGKRIGKVVNRIGDKVKSTVKKVRVGIKKIGSKIGSHVKRFGKGIAKIGKNIGRGVAKITKKVGRGIKKFGQGVKKTGKKVWKKIKKIFGKRSTRHLIEKRCVSSCPVCDKLDKEIFTDEQIVGKICGASFVSRQKQLYEKVRGLEDTYNYIVSNAPVVTKVEYETSSIIIVNGKLAFKKSFVTYQTNKINRRFQLSGLFEISNIDGMAVIISKDILKKMQ
ncbi:Hypothetical predicted protein [Mytilus galloprovincialis]|uniref:Uncharacterized protein n=1 Tax=Mytilus galloprovincialis TaxID=29158 RepID=A0A8B6C0V3_MYTGA|nr:Hypothetical predicted protein [Mytilus galloprovincialis]